MVQVLEERGEVVKTTSPCLIRELTHVVTPPIPQSQLWTPAPASSPLSGQNWVPATHRLNEYALVANVINFIKALGLNHCLFWTLTFPFRLGHKKAVEAVQELMTQMAAYFRATIRVTGYHGPNRRLHLHGLAACHEDVHTGFNFYALASVRVIKAEARAVGRPLSLSEQAVVKRLEKTFTPNQALRRIQKQLEKHIRGSAFGWRYQAHPLYGEADHVARYLASNYIATVRNKPASFYRAQLIAYSQGCPRLFKGTFRRVDRPEMRRKYAAIGAAIGIGTIEKMGCVHGPKWAYHMRNVIALIELHHGSDPKRWPAGQIREAVDLHLTKQSWWSRVPV